MNEEFICFEDIANNQIEIEGQIKYYTNGRQTFSKIWKNYKKLFEEIEDYSPSIDNYLEIFYTVLNIDWYKNIINEKPNDQHHFTNRITYLDNLKFAIENYTPEPIKVIFPKHQNKLILDLKEFLKDKKVEKSTIAKVIHLVKKEFNIKNANQTNRDREIKKFIDFVKISEAKTENEKTKLINSYTKKYPKTK